MAAASATAPMISGAVFGGSSSESEVIDFTFAGGSKVYRSGAIFPAADGGHYNELYHLAAGTSVPEPSTFILILLGIGLAGLGSIGRRRRNA